MIAFITILAVVFVSLILLGLVSITVSRSVTGYANGNQTTTFTDAAGVTADPTVLPAQPATLTTHTTNTTGSLTMTNSSHGIVTGQRLDIFWTGGQCYGAVAGTVAGAVVPIASVSGGSNLPASSTPVTVGIPIQTAFVVTGNNLQSLVLVAGQPGYFVFDQSGTDEYAAYFPAAGVNTWSVGDIGTNPLAGFAITTVWISTNYVTASVTTSLTAAVTH